MKIVCVCECVCACLGEHTFLNGGELVGVTCMCVYVCV
jgi:hypothetical protein